MAEQTIQNWVKQANQREHRNKIIPSKDILPVQSGDGIALHLVGEQETVEAGDKYDGFYKTTNSSTEELTSITVKAGKVLINNQYFEVPETVVEITEDSYVYLLSTISGIELIQPFITSSPITPEDIYPVWSEGGFKGLIADVTLEDGDITSIDQHQFGMMYGTIWGTC